MVYAVSDVTRHKAQDSPLAGPVARGQARKIPIAERAVSIQWPRTIALGLNTLVWIGIIAGARWLFHR